MGVRKRTYRVTIYRAGFTTYAYTFRFQINLYEFPPQICKRFSLFSKSRFATVDSRGDADQLKSDIKKIFGF